MISPLFESVPPLYYGGTERVVSNLCKGLAEQNIDVTLFASGDSQVGVKLVPVVDVALRLRKKPISDPNAYHLRMLSLVAERAHEFDLIHNHNDYWMLPLSQMTDVPILTTLHGRMDEPDKSVAFQGLKNNYYVSISDSQRLPMPQINWVKTIYHGINLNEFRFYEKPGKYLAFLGRICPEKRPEWAIELAHRSGVPLKIAAKIEGVEGQSHFDRFVKPHLDGKFIEYIGEISESEKSEFLGNALALVFPIDWPEPFGLVLLESLACGTPVIARPCGAVRELLEDGVTGYMNSRISTLAKIVKNIPSLSRKTCRDWVEKRFSLQRMTEDYIHVYRHVAAKKVGSHRHRWNFLYPVQRTAHGGT